MQASHLHIERLFVESLGYTTQSGYQAKASSVLIGSIEPSDLMISVFGGTSRPTREPALRLSVELPDWGLDGHCRPDQAVNDIESAPEALRPKYPYRFQISIVGFFRIDEAVPEEDIEKVVGVSAPALLYGAAREAVLSATGRGPWRPLLLPSVHFADYAGEQQSLDDGEHIALSQREQDGEDGSL